MALLCAKKTKIDLLSRYSFDPVAHEKRVKTIMYVIPGAVIVLIMAALVLVNLFKGMSLDNDIADYENKIAGLEASANDVIELEKSNRKLTADLEILKNAEDASKRQAEKYSYLSSKLLADVRSACNGKADVELMDYSNDGISFTFKLRTGNYNDISGIVKNIENLEFFETVTYTGYSKIGDEDYSFNVMCTFITTEEESEAAE